MSQPDLPNPFEKPKNRVDRIKELLTQKTALEWQINEEVKQGT